MQKVQISQETNRAALETSRREFLSTSAVAAAAIGTVGLFAPRPAVAGIDSEFFILTGWIHAKLDCGAAGDGLTDDTAALQAGINRSGDERRPLFLPPGTYRITSALNVPKTSDPATASDSAA